MTQRMFIWYPIIIEKKIKESGTVESTSRIINSIINDEDSDTPDSLNNNKTSQIDIKMTDIILTL